LPRRVVRHENVGIADVARKEGTAVGGHLPGDGQGLAVQRLQEMLFADDAQLLAVGVVGEGLDDVGARVHEVAVDLPHHLGMLEHDLGYESAGLQVPALLAREEIAFRANDGAACESLEKAKRGLGRVVSHGRPPECGGCSSSLAYTIHWSEEARLPYAALKDDVCLAWRTGTMAEAGFWGYRRADGRVGVRNHVLVLPGGFIAGQVCRLVPGVATLWTADKGYGRTARDRETIFRVL